MPEAVSVSFVVPLFNCLSFTQACVSSLLKSLPAGLRYEVVLVDDGSTDGTREWLAKLSAPFTVVLNPRNLGYAGANNQGARAARGQTLVLINNDLIFTPGWLEPLLSTHRKMGSQSGILGNIQINARTGKLDHAGIDVSRKGKPEHSTFGLYWPWSPNRKVPAVTGACMLIDRELYLGMGGFDEGFTNGGEDVDMCFRVAALGRSVGIACNSRILHFVSTSPGRKKRDEENSRRLTLRWKDRLAHHGVRNWCWSYLEREWTAPNPEGNWMHAVQALGYAVGLRSAAPEFAMRGIDLAIDRELERWTTLLGPVESQS